ncbi:MAG: SMP-30/gluconolactonase/LRE family protein [Rhodothermales bacterium]|nr:SMP-30/gluconolactonase/LRE family protein [Rhodothermales bacterium]MBO6780848.1 SMP-30/gluconolactonase/LRE family protein [Rhodothermales bacterium]
MPLLAQWEVSTPVPSANGLDDGMVFDQSGNLYISQYQGAVVRRITPDGTVSVFAEGFDTPNGLAVDGAGNLYVANVFGGRISRVTPGGTVTQDFISVANPSNVLFNAAGDTLYIAHYRTSRISKVAIADPGNVTTWVSGAPLNGPIGMAFDADRNLYVGNYNNGRIFRISPAGDITELASIQSFLGFLVLSNGFLYATSYNRNEVYRISMDGSSVEVIAGSGAKGQADGVGTAASFDGPNGIVASSTGDTLYVSEFNTGTLRMLVSSVPTHADAAEVPRGGLLSLENYPNPFTASTTITYTLGEPGQVSVEIYNMLGQRVRTLTAQSIAGVQSMQWDGRNDAGQRVPPATYLYTMRSGDLVESRLLIRR